MKQITQRKPRVYRTLVRLTNIGSKTRKNDGQVFAVEEKPGQIKVPKEVNNR